MGMPWDDQREKLEAASKSLFSFTLSQLHSWGYWIIFYFYKYTSTSLWVFGPLFLLKISLESSWPTKLSLRPSLHPSLTWWYSLESEVLVLYSYEPLKIDDCQERRKEMWCERKCDESRSEPKETDLIQNSPLHLSHLGAWCLKLIPCSSLSMCKLKPLHFGAWQGSRPERVPALWFFSINLWVSSWSVKVLLDGDEQSCWSER